MLLEDSMLRDVHSNQFEDTVVKSMSGAKLSDITQELNNHDDISSFRNIINHCGTNDVSNGSPAKDIVDQMETTVTLVMIASPDTSIYV